MYSIKSVLRSYNSFILTGILVYASYFDFGGLLPEFVDSLPDIAIVEIPLNEFVVGFSSVVVLSRAFV